MARSLGDSIKLVPDALHLVPSIRFEPENTLLGSYTFLPWVRGGIGAAIATVPGADASRASVTVTLPVQGGVENATVAQTLHVRGPGDVVGLDERQVVRRYPRPGTTNAEATFLAHVEFDRPDLPWLFSPVPTAGNRLPPWLVLVVVDAGISTLQPGHGGLPPRLSTRLGELQPLEDSFAWAHAQTIPVQAGADGRQPSIEDTLSAQYGPINLSRLICPRHLDPNAGWLACIVPAYDAGVKAGLGAPAAGTLGPAWTRAGADADVAIELPVYSSWTFHTGPAGDFESLAKKLDGVPAPWQIGRRVMDTAKPDGGLPPLGAGDRGRLQTVRGPLISPQKPQADSPDAAEAAAAVAEDAGWPPAETEALRTLLNAPDRLAGKEGALSAQERPLIGPEIYARYHAARSRVEAVHDGDWFGQLNLRPPQRVVGGLGTRVVQKDQEVLMQSAWAQVGDIDAANRQLRGAQLARFVGSAMHERHLSPLAYGDALQVTRGAHGRILDGELTVAATLADSRVADAAVTPAFRRVTRPLGLLARHVEGRRAELDRLVVDDGAPRDFQRAYRELDGLASVSDVAAPALDSDVVARVLEVDRDHAEQALLDHGAMLERTVALPDALTTDAVLQAQPDTSFSVHAVATEALLASLTASLPDPDREPARAVSYADLLFALAFAGGPAAQPAERLAGDLAARLARSFDIHVSGQPTGQLPGLLGSAREASIQGALDGLLPIADELVSERWPGTPVLPPLAFERPTLLARLDPAVTVTGRVKARIGVHPPWLPVDWFDDQLVQPIMAAPVFQRPMYEALDAYSRNWLIPNLGSLPQPDLVTVLESNAAFIEAFFAGLSHEMGRELLWRGYPTDQRGTYFRRFWKRDRDELVQALHHFTDIELGKHVDPTLGGRLVLLVRGELIRRYPDALVLAMKAGERVPPPAGHPVFIDPVNTPLAMAASLFHTHLEPDIVLAGFDLTAEQVRTEDWWFVIAEHPTGPRFGLDDPPRLESLNKDTLVWPSTTPPAPPVPADLPMRPGDRFLNANVTKVVPDAPVEGAPPPPVFTFGADAASTAHILLQSPIRAAWDARKLLAPMEVR